MVEATADTAKKVVMPSLVMPAMDAADIHGGYMSCVEMICHEFCNEVYTYTKQAASDTRELDYVIDCIRHVSDDTYIVEWRLLVTDIVDNDLKKSMTSIYNMVTNAYVYEKMFRGKLRQRVRLETITTPSFMETAA